MRGSVLKEIRFEPTIALLKRVVHLSFGQNLDFQPYAVVAASQCLLDEAQVLLETTICKKISNASPLQNMPSGDLFRSKAKFDGKIVKIGYLGHPYAHKGCVDLIQSSLILNDERQFTAAFSHSGSKKVRRYWTAMGGSAIGTVNPDEFLSNLDLLCLPLYADFGTMVFPNVLLEAMRVGVPILTTKLPSIIELVGENPPFPLIEEVNPRNIAEGIKEFEKCNVEVITEYLHERYSQVSPSKVRSSWQDLLKL